jgi:hypothetical protein
VAHSPSPGAHLGLFGGKRERDKKYQRNPDTSIITHGNSIIRDIYNNNMALLSFAIDPFGHLGPILHHFLFDKYPNIPLRFPPMKPNTTAMYSRIMMFPSLKGIFKLADCN